MNMMSETNFFRDDPWEGIDAGAYPAGKRLYLKDERFWVSKNQYNELIFFIQDKCFELIPKILKLPSLELKIEPYTNNEKRLTCTYKETSKDNKEKFAIVIKSVAFETDKHNGLNLFNAIQKELHSWSSFLKIHDNSLSRSELIGLWGELYVLSNLLMKSHKLKDVINYWTGPEGGKKDFTLNKIALEVKTTTTSDPNEIKINSLDQLDITSEKLFLIHLQINNSDQVKGESLTYFHELIQSKLKQDFNSLTLYLKKIGTFINRASNIQKEESFLCSKTEMYSINNEFPRLIKNNVPNEVMEASYFLSISKIQQFNVTDAMMEIINNA